MHKFIKSNSQVIKYLCVRTHKIEGKTHETKDNDDNFHGTMETLPTKPVEMVRRGESWHWKFSISKHPS